MRRAGLPGVARVIITRRNMCPYHVADTALIWCILSDFPLMGGLYFCIVNVLWIMVHSLKCGNSSRRTRLRSLWFSGSSSNQERVMLSLIRKSRSIVCWKIGCLLGGRSYIKSHLAQLPTRVPQKYATQALFDTTPVLLVRYEKDLSTHTSRAWHTSAGM